MSLYFVKNSNGIGFYDDTIHGTIPPGAKKITEAQHQALLAGQTIGKVISTDASGDPILIDQPDPDLETTRAGALARMDREAETLRSLFITASPGQIATYIMKYNDATAFKAAGYTGDVPLLVQAEADATGDNAQEAANAIIAQYLAWNTLAGHIERARRVTKVAITNADSHTLINSSLASGLAAFEQIRTQAAGTQV